MNKILIALLIVLAALAAILLGPLREAGPTEPLHDGPHAKVILNAFHWGWVPELIESGPGVRVEVAPGAQGSRVVAPRGTKLTLILRNAGALPELHHEYEERFEEFFIEKYGEAWRNAHQVSHEADEQNGEAHHDEMMSGAMDESMMDHSFFLEGYDVEVMLGHKQGEHEQIVELTLNQTGEFQFMCMNFCGLGHGDMRGTLVVQ